MDEGAKYATVPANYDLWHQIKYILQKITFDSTA